MEFFKVSANATLGIPEIDTNGENTELNGILVSVSTSNRLIVVDAQCVKQWTAEKSRLK